MLSPLPKTRWAPLEGEPYKVPREMVDGKLKPRVKSDFELAFDGARTRYDIGECQTLIYGSIAELPKITLAKSWLLTSFYSIIAKFPSVAAACWFLRNLDSMEITQQYRIAIQESQRDEPTGETETVSYKFVAVNEFRNSRGTFEQGEGEPDKGWTSKVWHARSHLADAHHSYLSTSPDGSGGDLPAGRWVLPRHYLRALGKGQNECIDITINGIVEIQGKAYLIGHCWAGSNVRKGREGCAFASFYLECKGSTQAKVDIDTPFGKGEWYYHTFKLQSKFIHNGKEVMMPTGAENASIDFAFWG